jgi:hypothetical protein
LILRSLHPSRVIATQARVGVPRAKQKQSRSRCRAGAAGVLELGAPKPLKQDPRET